MKWSKPTERSEGEIYEGSPIPHRGDVTSIFHRVQGTVVYGDVVSIVVYRSLRRMASILLRFYSARRRTRRVKLRLRFAPLKMTHKISPPSGDCARRAKFFHFLKLVRFVRFWWFMVRVSRGDRLLFGRRRFYGKKEKGSERGGYGGASRHHSCPSGRSSGGA